MERAALLLDELNRRSFPQLRAWAAGSRPRPEPERVRIRLLTLIEHFVSAGQLTPEILRHHAPPKVAATLGDDLRGPEGQEALRQMAAELAAVLLGDALPSRLQEWFDRLRPRLLRRAPEMVPWLLRTLSAVGASDLMASWGLAISEEHAARIDPALRAQRRAIENGVKLFYERLRSPEPLDAMGLADAALDDFEDLTRGFQQIKNQVVSPPRS